MNTFLDQRVLERLRAEYLEMPGLKLRIEQVQRLVLSTHAGDMQARRALQAGACGYLLKDAVAEELLETIRAVQAGKRILSPTVSQGIAEHATEDALTTGEIDVLRLIAEGKANKQIADRLAISVETVKSRVKNILSKLGADNRTHAAMTGLKRGIIEL
jgi:DNA-binding NarL/FixJ family response regulator